MVEPLITLGKEPERWPIAAWRSSACATATSWSSCSASWARATRRARAATPRILKMGFRVGDNAPMAFVELVDRPEPVAADEAKGEGAAKAD